MPNSNLTTTTAFIDGILNSEKFQSDSSITTTYDSVTQNTTANSGRIQSDSSINTTYESVTQNRAGNGISMLPILIGIGVVILIVLTAVVVITLVLYLRKFTKSKSKSNYDNSYSTLCRRDTQQLQPCSQQDSTDLYDRIQLSPSTGQAKVISNAEIENINSLPSYQTDNSPNHDKEQSRLSNASISEQPTYTTIKENKLMKGKRSRQNQNSAADEKECSFTATEKIDVKHEQKNIDEINWEETTPTSVYTTESPQALYTVVKKKSKATNADNEDKVSSTPPHSVEELCTAIKDVKGGTTEEEGAPQVPPHTVEDLYTAVIKKPKNDTATDSDTEAAPPLPPHTVEELYAAVQKGNIAKDEEEAPPIPPQTLEELYAAIQNGSTVKDEEEAPPIPPQTLENCC